MLFLRRTTRRKKRSYNRSLRGVKKRKRLFAPKQKRTRRRSSHRSTKKKIPVSAKRVRARKPTKRRAPQGARVRRRHKHDLTVSPGLRLNPFIPRAGEPWYLKLFRPLLFATLLGLLWVVVFNPAFHVSNVSINGTNRIPEQELQATIDELLNGERLFLFPARSYAFVPMRGIQSVIEERFPVRDVQLQKTFPDTLAIIIQEQVSSVIYDNTEQFFLFDDEGKLMEPLRRVASYEWETAETPVLTTSTDESPEFEQLINGKRVHSPDIASFATEHGVLPILVDERPNAPETINTNDKAAQLPASLIGAVLSWYQTFEDNNLVFQYMRITDPRSDYAEITDQEGRVYTISLKNDLSPQLAKINTLLDEHEDISRIDVRFPGRVYWE